LTKIDRSTKDRRAVYTSSAQAKLTFEIQKVFIFYEGAIRISFQVTSRYFLINPRRGQGKSPLSYIPLYTYPLAAVEVVNHFQHFYQMHYYPVFPFLTARLR
jgi:hypothetical protein